MYGYLFTYTYMSVHLVYMDVIGLPWFHLEMKKKKPQSKIVYTFMKHAQKEKIFLKPQLGITESQIKGRLYEIE